MSFCSARTSGARRTRAGFVCVCVCAIISPLYYFILQDLWLITNAWLNNISIGGNINHLLAFAPSLSLFLPLNCLYLCARRMICWWKINFANKYASADSHSLFTHDDFISVWSKWSILERLWVQMGENGRKSTSTSYTNDHWNRRAQNYTECERRKIWNK